MKVFIDNPMKTFKEWLESIGVGDYIDTEEGRKNLDAQGGTVVGAPGGDLKNAKFIKMKKKAPGMPPAHMKKK